MSPYGQCPRGHALEENAVYCTVCWIRVEPEDPERVAARRRRQRRIWIPLFGAGAVVLGMAVGGTLASVGGSTADPSAVLAAAPVSTQPSPAVPSPRPSTAAEEPAAVTAVPLAATVAEPTLVTVCLPERTATVVVRTRTDPGRKWAKVASTAALETRGACADGEAEATVTLAESVEDGGSIKVVARDEAGTRLARVKVRPSAG
jgi:hypothetical protein